MNSIQNFTRMFSLYAFSNIIEKGALFLFFVLFARVYGPSSLGQYSYAMAWASFVGAIVILGLDNRAIRDIGSGKYNPTEFLRFSFPLIAVGTSVAFTVWILIDRLNGVIRNTEIMFFSICVSIVLDSLCILFSSVLRGMQKMKYHPVINVIWALSLVLLLSISLANNFTPSDTVMICSISYLIKFGLYSMAIIEEKIIPSINSLSFNVVFLRGQITFFVIMALLLLFANYPRIVIEYYLGIEFLGQYSAIDRIVQAVMLLFVVFDMIIYPLLSKYAGSDSVRLVSAYSMLMKLLLLISSLISFVIVLFSKEIVYLVFGLKYYSSYVLLCSFAPLISASIVGYLNGKMFFVINKENDLMIMTGIVIICAMIGGLLLIPHWGIYGIIVPNTIAIWVSQVFSYYYFR